MRGHIIKRGKMYSIVLELEPAADKKRRQKWIGGFKTKKAAELELAKKILEIENGSFINEQTVTFGEYLNHWLDIHKTKIAERTHTRYKYFVDLYLTPALGNIPLIKLKPMQIQKLYADTLESKVRVKKSSKKVSPTTVHHMHGVLHKAMSDAVKWKMLNNNPADSVTPPKRIKKDCHVPSDIDLQRIISATQGIYLEMPVFVAVSTGARMGEILGLTWQNVDLKKGTIYINQQLMRRRDGTLVITGTKTGYSRRTVEIGASTIKRLKEHKRQQAEWKLKAGEVWKGEDYVCTLEDGSPINPNNIGTMFCRLTKRLKVNSSFHDLRHYHATALLKAGINPKIVSERLGHSTVSITLDIYSHVLPSMQKEAVAAIEAFMRF